MFSKFTKIRTDDEDLTEVQQNIEAVLEPLFTVPIHDGIYLRDVSLNAGSNRILHKLERDYIGYIVCNARPTNTGNLTTGAWQSFTPSITGLGGLTWTTTTLSGARYRVQGNTCEMQVRVAGTTGGVANATLNMSLTGLPPLDTAASTDPIFCHAYVNDGGGLTGLVGINYQNNNISIYRDPGASNYTLGAGRILSFSIIYQVSPSYGLSSEIIEGVSSDRSVALNLICGSPMTASLLVY